MNAMQERDGRERLLRELLTPKQVSEDRDCNREETGERPWQTKTHASPVTQELKQDVLGRRVRAR